MRLPRARSCDPPEERRLELATSTTSQGPISAEIQGEQQYIDRAYERLEVMKERARGLAAQVIGESRGGTHQARLERDVWVHTSLKRLAHLEFGDEPLVFGRIDLNDGHTFYIGRVAVTDEDQNPIVVDWRAPAAEPFYRATGTEPMGVIRRRHFMCRGQRLVNIDDELLDAEAPAKDLVLIGEGALFAALERSRTGQMRDIVATIQAEQDQIIRAPLPGAIVIQGGPGTGKTAVALHRSAYLLYTYRAKLEKEGILVVGPNPVFIRYIETVLPSLGEEDVRLSTAPGLLSDVDTDVQEASEVERVKGDLRMQRVIESAVKARQRPLQHDLSVLYGEFLVVVSPSETRELVRKVGRARGDHNSRRAQMVESMLGLMYRNYRQRVDEALKDGTVGPELRLISEKDRQADREGFLQQMRGERVLAEALDEMWPALTPTVLLEDLYASKRSIEEAARRVLRKAEVLLLQRQPGTPWSRADAALLDEAALLLGPLPRAAGDEEENGEEEDKAWMAERVLEDMGVDGHMRSMLSERLMGELQDLDPRLPLERTKFGHIVVDEAQDISPMQWRAISRRAPSGSFTVAGDLGQASGVWGASDWSEALDPLQVAKSEIVELSINYRTPSEVMDFAGRVLAATNPGLKPPRSVRSTGKHPQFVRVESEELADAAARTAKEQLAALGEGNVAVICPAPMLERQRAAIGGSEKDGLDAPVTVLPPEQVKGLEFDGVVVVEPGEIAREGLRALYVAMTRPTQLLSIVHSAALPEALAT